jgi:hypothetical protein
MPADDCRIEVIEDDGFSMSDGGRATGVEERE